MSLSFKQLRTVNASRSLRWHKTGLQEWSLEDWAVAVGGEVGEALNVVKKLNRDRDQQPGNSQNRNELLAHLADELADAVIYLDIVLQRWRPSVLLGEDFLTFAAWRVASEASEMHAHDERPASFWGCRALIKAGQLADCVLNAHPNIGFLVNDLLEELDKLAWCAGIDLGAAVERKFNATSKRYGFPERLFP